MNLIAFLKKVDTAAAQRSKEQLLEFIHQWARVLPEEQRTVFLAQLSENTMLSPEEKTSLKADRQQTESDSFQEKIAMILEDLKAISESDIQLTGNWNEEYDDWYNNEVDEFLYEDPDGIGAIIDRAIGLAHECIDTEAYADAYTIGAALIGLKISVESDGYELESLDIFYMKESGKISGNLHRLITETLSAAYRISSPDERPKVLYGIFEQAQKEPVSFEDVMQSSGNELPDLPEFFPVWTAHLGKIKGELSRRLFEEAAFLPDDIRTAVHAASEYADTHPGLYRRILIREKENADFVQMLSLGQKALADIGTNLRIRSEIALLTAEAALKLDDPSEAERCWLEAFRSDPRPVQYLRLCTECQDFSRYHDAARELYQTWQKPEYTAGFWNGEKNELARNQISECDFYTLNFLDGSFRKVMDQGMRVKEPLGWSATFMKRGISLFLLYLYQGERLESGLKYLCGRIVKAMPFYAEKYAAGLARSVTESDEGLFWERFQVWRGSVPMEEEFQREMIQRLENWLAFRIEGIMTANRRKYYDECAGFAAALGEVKESRGEIGGRQTELLSWRAKYPRRTAFHQELRRFGMKDGK